MLDQMIMVVPIGMKIDGKTKRAITAHLREEYDSFEGGNIRDDLALITVTPKDPNHQPEHGPNHQPGHMRSFLQELAENINN